MFTSFLFEPALDVVNLDKQTVNELSGWDRLVTITSPEDIGRLATAIYPEWLHAASKVMFIASQTLIYATLAKIF